MINELLDEFLNIQCNHKFEIIRQEEGVEKSFFVQNWVMIYHLQCKKCGVIIHKMCPIVCRTCNRNVKLRKIGGRGK